MICWVNKILCENGAYTIKKERKFPMRRIAGFILFWIAVGMTITLLMTNVFWIVVLILAFALIGLWLFCC
jgi:hypothetical protein